ncbi:MAG: ABC transporter substrate-binding protein, partial [Betaproteobacteria bacterium]
MMATLVRAFRLLSAVALLAIVEGASAQAPVRIGLIGEFTGPFADYGTQIYNGIKAYL